VLKLKVVRYSARDYGLKIDNIKEYANERDYDEKVNRMLLKYNNREMTPYPTLILALGGKDLTAKIKPANNSTFSVGGAMKPVFCTILWDEYDSSNESYYVAFTSAESARKGAEALSYEARMRKPYKLIQVE
jgi:hypothetical protein